MSELMRVRAFEYPYAWAILEEIKHIEVASQITQPGTIAIYAKKREMPRKQKEELIKHFNKLNINGFIEYETFTRLRESVLYPENLGCVLGTVEIAYVRKNISELQFRGSEGMHIAPKEYYKEGHTQFWVMRNPVKFDKPIEIKWNSCGPWGKVDKSILGID